MVDNFKEISFEELEKIAKSGNVDAQLYLGMLYQNGRYYPDRKPVHQDLFRAAYWFEKAYQNGENDAAWMLGVLFFNNQSYAKYLPYSYFQALEYLRIGANNEDNIRKFALGCFFLGGNIFGSVLDEPDIEEALHWLHEAAEANDDRSQLFLAELYDEGKIVNKDHELASKYYLAAAMNGQTRAQLEIGKRYWCGLGVPFSGENALNWLAKAAQNDGMEATEAEILLAFAYRTNKITDVDLKKSNIWKKRIDPDEAEDEINLAFHDIAAIIDDRIDPYQIIKIFLLLINSRQKDAWHEIGLCFLTGAGFPKDYNLAYKSFAKASWYGNADATFELGELHAHGKGVEQDLKEAIRFYNEAAKSGHIEAHYRLSECYRDGRGVPIDIDEAERWRDEAVRLSSFSAKHP